MPVWLQSLPFTSLDLMVIVVNLTTFLAASVFIRWSANNRSEKVIQRRVVGLRLINLIFLSVYLVAGVLQFRLAQQFSQIGLSLLVAYGINHWIQLWILNRFGAERTVNDEVVMAKSYTSGMIGLLALMIVIALTMVTLLNILELDNWLQASSVVGAFILILYASKDYLLSDIISSLTMHYSRTIEPGAVIRVRELNILGVVQKVSLLQTTLRDLVHNSDVVLDNSKLRSAVIENLSSCHRLTDYVDFKIGYSTSKTEVEQLCAEIWQALIKKEPSMAPIVPDVFVVNNM